MRRIILGVIGSQSVLGGGGDPYYNLVTTLLHFDGTPGTRTIVDETGRVWAGNGFWFLTDSPSMFGQAAQFSSGQFVSASSPDFSYGPPGTDVTIEGFVMVTNGSVQRYFFGSAPSPSVHMSRTTAGALSATWATSTITSADGIFNLGTWYHVALVRQGTAIKIFLNGSLVGQTTSNADVSSPTRSVSLGHAAGMFGSSNSLSGLLDEWRFTQGVARYTSNFTPPNEPFPSG